MVHLWTLQFLLPLYPFAVGTAHVDNIVSQDFKDVDHRLVFFDVPRMYDDTPDWDRFKENCDVLQEQIEKVVFTPRM